MAEKIKDVLTVAIAKGRLFDKVTRLLADTEWVEPGKDFPERALRFSVSPQLEMLVVRAKDVPTYVARGVAHAGICGLDTILESGREFLELVDLKLGACQLSLAGQGTRPAHLGTLATKFPRLTRLALEPLGIMPELIPLGGALELAPLVGLADGIVDLVETGQTLKDNGLQVWDELMPISTRLFTIEAQLVRHNRLLSQFADDLTARLPAGTS